MRKKTALIILGLIFAVVLAGRLWFALQTSDFSYDGYYELRQIESVRETGKPIFQDDLSYSGRTQIFPPLFHYVIAFFTLFMPVTLAAKIIPNILASLTLVIVYFITFELTKRHGASLISAFFSGFLLIFFTKTLNTVSPYTLVIPLTFMIAYCFLKIKEPKYLYAALILLLCLVLTHTAAFILVLALLFFFLIAKLESFKPVKERVDLFIFLTFLIFWFNFIIYKNAFLAHGARVIWQNTPQQILSSYFSQITFLEAVYAMGVIPLIFGVYAVYHSFFENRQRSAYLFVAFAISVFVLLWFKLIELNVGLMFLGVVLAILAGVGMKLLAEYFKKTRFPKMGACLIVVFLVLFFMTSVFPLLNAAAVEIQETPSYEEKAALEWLNNHTSKDAIVLATLNEGHVINYLGQRRNVIDSNFLMIPLIDQRYEDVNLIFRTPYKTDALRKIGEYGVTHIYLSPLAEQEYGLVEPVYIDDPECFSLVYNETVRIYLVLCGMD